MFYFCIFTFFNQIFILCTAQKTIFSFSKCFANMVFPKKLHWNIIFLILSGKMIFLFPENMILFSRHKRKDDLSRHKRKDDLFFKYSEKMVFPKNSRLNTISFVISGKIVFLFSRKYDIFSLGGKWKKMIFIKKSMEIWYFLYICAVVTGVTLPPQQKTKMPRKNTPKSDISSITEKDDIHPRFILDSSFFCWNAAFIDTLERAQEAATRYILQEKVFLEISQNSQWKTYARTSFFNKATDLKPSTLLGLQLC